MEIEDEGEINNVLCQTDKSQNEVKYNLGATPEDDPKMKFGKNSFSVPPHLEDS